jgi:hypothetical protein
VQTASGQERLSLGRREGDAGTGAGRLETCARCGEVSSLYCHSASPLAEVGGHRAEARGGVSSENDGASSDRSSGGGDSSTGLGCDAQVLPSCQASCCTQPGALESSSTERKVATTMTSWRRGAEAGNHCVGNGDSPASGEEW